MNPKPEAKVLDCTSANRKFWIKRESDKVLWTDIEPELEVSPDIVVDIRATDFGDGQFNTVIFDPPHYWGNTTGEAFYSCRNLEESEALAAKYNFKRRGIPSYYGTDKYATKKSLLGFINAAQKEIYRILNEGGVLWFNWCDIKIPLEKILPFFDKRWDIMIKLQIGSRKQSLSKHQNWWVMLMKKEVEQ